MIRKLCKLTELNCSTGYAREIIKFLRVAMLKNDPRSYMKNLYIHGNVLWATDGRRVHFVDAPYMIDGAYRVEMDGRDQILRRDTVESSKDYYGRADIKNLIDFSRNPSPVHTFDVDSAYSISVEYTRTLSAVAFVASGYTDREYYVDLKYWIDAMKNPWWKLTREWEVYAALSEMGRCREKIPTVTLIGKIGKFKESKKFSEAARIGAIGTFGVVILPILK